MYDVVALGELLIDFTTQSIDSDGYPTMAAHPGGAPANFLAAIAKFGGKVGMLGKVGTDTFGKLLTNTLRGAGIETKGLVAADDVFTTLAFVTLAGFNLAKSTAHAKVLNATSNVGGLLLFIIGGKVIWATGFVMMAGQFLGARAGSRLVLSKGQKLIRPMIVIVSAVMSAKLLYDSHGQEILTWLGMH